MKKKIVVSSLLQIIALTFSNTNSHANDLSLNQIRARMDSFRSSRRDPFPFPNRTINEYHQIENELTPVPIEVPLKQESFERGLICDAKQISISYKLTPTSPLETFSAILKTPSRGIRRALRLKKIPVIIVQPTLAGPSVLENRGIADPLCRNGFASIVPTETKLGLSDHLPDLASYDRNVRVEMIRARRMVDVVMLDETLDSSRIGLIGFSRGAIAGALLAGIEPRIKFAFLGAGGVGNGRIIARSQTERGREENGQQLAAFAAAGNPISQSEFERRIIETIRYDGILFSHRLDPRRIKLMTVENDSNVPTENQKLLEQVICRNGSCPVTITGDPKLTPNVPDSLREHTSEGKLGVHVSSIVNLVFLHPNEFVDFLKEQIR